MCIHNIIISHCCRENVTSGNLSHLPTPLLLLPASQLDPGHCPSHPSADARAGGYFSNQPLWSVTLQRYQRQKYITNRWLDFFHRRFFFNFWRRNQCFSPAVFFGERTWQKKLHGDTCSGRNGPPRRRSVSRFIPIVVPTYNKWHDVLFSTLDAWNKMLQ